MTGAEGLTECKLTHASGAAATVHLLGACVTSWTQSDGHDILYCRPDAKFDGSKPISGGIPHCFPQFGPGEMQQHGFARNLDWDIGSTSADVNPDDPDPSVEMVLEPSDYTKDMYESDFKAIYRVTLRASQLICEMAVVNTGDAPLTFTGALHSYFAAKIGDVQVKGLEGLTYLDKIVDGNNPPEKEAPKEPVTISGPVDSVYLNAPEEVNVITGHPYDLEIQNASWPDVVVWSPWDEMPEAYPNFVCVENAVAKDAVTVPAGETWTSQAVINAVKK